MIYFRIESGFMKRSYIILIIGTIMLIVGNFLGNALLNSVFTSNPNNSHLITDTNYDLISLSNSFLITSQLGIVILVLGGFVFFIDRIRKK